MTHLREFAIITVASAVACSATPKLQSAGGGCLLVTDCQNGLVCVKQRCSSDLSGIVDIEDAAQATPGSHPAAGDSGDDADAPAAAFGDDTGDTTIDDAPTSDATQDMAALQ